MKAERTFIPVSLETRRILKSYCKRMELSYSDAIEMLLEYGNRE